MVTYPMSISQLRSEARCGYRLRELPFLDRHLLEGDFKLGSAIAADPIGILADGKHAAQVAVVTPKRNSRTLAMWLIGPPNTTAFQFFNMICT